MRDNNIDIIHNINNNNINNIILNSNNLHINNLHIMAQPHYNQVPLPPAYPQDDGADPILHQDRVLAYHARSLAHLSVGAQVEQILDRKLDPFIARFDAFAARYDRDQTAARNAATRARNKLSYDYLKEAAPLEPLRDPASGAVINPFPATVDDLVKLRQGEVNDLRAALGLPPMHGRSAAHNTLLHVI